MSAEKTENSKAPMSKKKKIIIAVVVVILLMNILWTLMQNKVATRVDALMGEMAKLEQRLVKLEGTGGPDIEALRTEIADMKKFADLYGSHLAESIKTEEARLSSLTSELENQKARIEALRAIATLAE